LFFLFFIVTEYDGDFLVWFGKWVGCIMLREDDEGSVDSSS
jgi:hypothetical protein